METNLSAYLATLSQSEQLIVHQCWAEAAKSKSTANFLRIIATDTEKELQEIWEFPETDPVKFGFAVDWSGVTADWDFVFETLRNSKRSLFAIVAKLLGLDIWILNFMLGLNIPRLIRQRSDRAKIGKAIIVAALLKRSDDAYKIN